MSVAVKICGLNEPEGMHAAIHAGARFVGLVFVASSSHLISAELARSLSLLAPSHIDTVGLFVDPSNDELLQIIQHVPLRAIQLHGLETPQRVLEVKRLTKLPVIKAVHLAAVEDLQQVPSYEAVADYILFDTKTGNKPTGGTGKTFDWNLLKGRSFKKPWMLAGGLNAQNLSDAIYATAARIVDVSSGVEDRRAHKSPEKIQAFISLAQQL